MRGSRETTTWHRGAVLILTVCSLAGCAAKREARVASPPLRFDDRAVTRDVVLVGNNWAGTAIAFDPKTHEILTTINIVPDREKRNEDIQKDHFFALAAGLNARLAGEGHDQLVDDLFTSSDGRYLFASRPTFADVVAIDLMTRDIVWRRPVAGHRADHAALSPDGERLLVSASTAGVVQEIDTTTGVAGGNSSQVTSRTRTTTWRTAHGSITPASAACSCRARPTSATGSRASGSSKSSTPGHSRCSSGST